MINDSLGNRMKETESVSKNFLMKRVPVILRIDGKAFHTFTRGFVKPFDSILSEAMSLTMKTLCENMQNCQFGYTQSDEISILLVDDKTITTDSWFGNNVQKMVSVGSSIATMAFNKAFSSIVNDTEVHFSIRDIYEKRFDTALFDCRAFNIPKEDVCNYFIWRQQDATRNSIQSVGQANFSPKQMHGLTCSMIQEKLFSEKGINWDKTPTKFKRGLGCIHGVEGWTIDTEIPVFSKDRTYIDKRVHIRED